MTGFIFPPFEVMIKNNLNKGDGIFLMASVDQNMFMFNIKIITIHNITT